MPSREDQREVCDCRIIHAERIAAARRNALNEPDQDRLANLFKAMGDPTRLKIMQALRLGEMCVCDLASFLEISESAVSHQLRILRQLYLVTNRREGPILYYRLNDDHIEQLINLGLEHIREPAK
jgi:ArsR family transcriptional regulator, lead/cadmium/zinc/bismuth-responsive transcriptional repressor